MNRRGFTVIELMVVIVVIGVLAGVAYVAYRGARDVSRDTARRSSVQQVISAIEALKLKTDVVHTGGHNPGGAGYTAEGLCQYSSFGWLYELPTRVEYKCNMGEQLMRTGLLANGFFDNMPLNDEYMDGKRPFASMMLQRCNVAENSYLLYYYLKKPTAEDRNNMLKYHNPSVCPNRSLSDAQVEQFKMRAVEFIDL